MPLSGRAFAPSLGLALVLFAFAEPARATDSCHPAPLLGTCINDDTLWPHAGASRFVGVGGTETVAEGRMGFGLVTTYLSRPIVLHIPSPGGAGSDQYAINDQVNATFLWAYGVTPRLELDLAVPITLGQGGTGLAPLTGSTARLQDTAVRDLRFGAAYAIVPRNGGTWGLTGRFEISAPIGDRDQFAGDRAAVFIPSLAADYRRGRWFAGIEIGLRARPTDALLNARVGTQGAAAVGVGVEILKRPELLAVMLEARSLPTFAAQQTTIQTPSGVVAQEGGGFLAPSEWMLSVRSAPLASGDLAIQLGGGGAIPLGDDNLTVPRFRVVLGLRYAPGADDHDGDGVSDPRDKCPTVHARTPDGCPASTAGGARAIGESAPAVAVAEVPHLDLARAPDVCKDDPDSVDGFKDDDGCPDEDADKDGVDDRDDQCPLVPEDYAGLTDGCPQRTTAPASTPAPPPLPPKSTPPKP